MTICIPVCAPHATYGCAECGLLLLLLQFPRPHGGRVPAATVCTGLASRRRPLVAAAGPGSPRGGPGVRPSAGAPPRRPRTAAPSAPAGAAPRAATGGAERAPQSSAPAAADWLGGDTGAVTAGTCPTDPVRADGAGDPAHHAPRPQLLVPDDRPPVHGPVSDSLSAPTPASGEEPLAGGGGGSVRTWGGAGALTGGMTESSLPADWGAAPPALGALRPLVRPSLQVRARRHAFACVVLCMC